MQQMKAESMQFLCKPPCLQRQWDTEGRIEDGSALSTSETWRMGPGVLCDWNLTCPSRSPTRSMARNVRR